MIPNLLLFLFKFVLIGLIYWVLLLLLRTVRQEMLQRVESRPQEAGIVPGRLRVVDPGGDPGAHPGQVLPLQPDTSLGAGPDNTIVLKDPFVSSRHARIRWDGAGWWIEDQGSRNGTLLNGTQVPPHSPTAVPPGGWVQVGGMTFILLEE